MNISMKNFQIYLVSCLHLLSKFDIYKRQYITLHSNLNISNFKNYLHCFVYRLFFKHL